MKKSSILHKFRDCIEDMNIILDAMTDLLDLEVEDEELNILGEKFREDIQGILDDDGDAIITLIEEL